MGESSSGATLTVGKYCYQATKFANGAFGSIHYGWEKDDPCKKVVVKIVGREQDARVKEAKVQKKLKGHINIVTLHRFFYDDGDDDDDLGPSCLLGCG